MEENREELREKNSIEGVKDTEVLSFGYLINVILDYYCETTSTYESGEAWKKGTEHEEKTTPEIPEEIDDLIKTAFESQLRKFIK